jgi:flagellar biogenesis protein FliO
VLETCHLGARQRVVALRMNEEVGILGVTEHGISLLTVLKEPVGDLRRARSGEGNSAAFSDNLNKLLERFKKPKKVSDMLDEEAR